MKILSSFTFILLATTAFAQDQEVQISHGRVSFAEDSGLIKGNDDADWSFAALNSLVMPGDQIWADEEGVLELEFSGGTYIRLADGSRMEVIETPPVAVYQGWQGSFYIQRVTRSNGDVNFETPVGSMSVNKNTQVRVDILKEGATTISVRWGSVNFTDLDGRTFRVNGGKRVYIDPGYSPSDPTAFNRADEDSFDKWNRDRARAIAIGSEYMPAINTAAADAPIGMRDLNDYGDWVYVDNRYFWRPTVVNNYIPYRRGSWSFVANQGHVWVGDYPFSYVTSHHGFWHNHHRHGWIWAYNHTYSPAYAATVRYGDRFVWAPLGLNGHVSVYNDDYFTAAGIRFSYGLATWAYVDHVLNGHHSVHIYSHHHHHHYDHGHINVHYWNLHNNHHHHNNHHNNNHYRPYQTHRYDQPARDYSPRRIMRGSDQDRGRVRTARETADSLRVRNSSDRTNLRVVANRDVKGLRTPLTSRNREASVRDIRIRKEATTRTVNRENTMSTRTIQRTDPRTGRDRTTTITTRNNDRGSISTRPTPSTTSVNSNRTGSTKNKTGRPTTTDRITTRSGEWTGGTSNGPDRKITRDTTNGNKSFKLDRRIPSVTTRPNTNSNRSTREQVSTPHVTTRQPSVTTRPNTNSNRSTREQVSAPRVTTRQPSVTSRPNTNSNRSTREQVSAPRVTTRQPTTTAPRVTTRQPAPSAPRVTTRQPSTSAPRVTTRQPAPSAPRVTTRQPSYTPPQRKVTQSSPSRSYKAPSTSSRSSSPSRSYSAPSTSSRSSSPSRSYSAPSTSSRSSAPSSRSSSSSGGSSRSGRVR